MKFQFNFNRCCRAGGGLALGITFHFPVTVTERFGISNQMVSIGFGFVFWRLHIHCLYNNSEMV